MTLSYLYSKIIKKLHGHSILRSDGDNTSAISVNCNVVECRIGKHTYLGHDTHAVRAEIGTFCSISDHVSSEGMSALWTGLVHHLLLRMWEVV